MQDRDLLIEELEKFYSEVEKVKIKLEYLNKNNLNCKKGCSACCIDGITVFEIEAEYIFAKSRSLKRSLKLENAGNKNGKCVFLNDENECLIYEFRPYVCRTQGLPLRWIDFDENDELVEFRDVCPLNYQGKSIEKLNEKYFWEIGPFERKLSDLQVKYFNNGNRIEVRKLYEKIKD